MRSLSRQSEAFYRVLARPFVHLFKLLRISANAVTLLGLGLGLAVGYLIYDGQTWYALGLFVLMMVLDHADGQLARATGTASPFGEYLDGVVDRVRTPIFLISISALLYRETGEISWVWLGFSANALVLLNALVFMQGARLETDTESKAQIKEQQQFDRGPRQVAVAIMNLDLVDWVNNSVLLILFLALQRLDLYLWVSVASGAYAILMKVLRQYLLQRLLGRKAD
jgi:phosphatidylglycerophosphate synthase